MSVAVASDQSFLEAIRTVGEEIAAPNADDVDREARFPAETVEALRKNEALSAFVPSELGGAGVSFEALAGACFSNRPKPSPAGSTLAIERLISPPVPTSEVTDAINLCSETTSRR